MREEAGEERQLSGSVDNPSPCKTNGRRTIAIHSQAYASEHRPDVLPTKVRANGKLAKNGRNEDRERSRDAVAGNLDGSRQLAQGRHEGGLFFLRDCEEEAQKQKAVSLSRLRALEVE